jgi:DNA-binding NarL/FixJ family response regulator
VLRIVIVDVHGVFRDALSAALAQQRDLKVVGVAKDAREAYEVVAATDPDLVVLDVSLPGIDGVGATRELLRRARRTKVLLLSAHPRADLVVGGLQAGAHGYALKDQPLVEVLDAIAQVAEGRTYLAPALPRSLVEARWRRPAGEETVDPLFALSTREKEIFHLVVRGHSNEGIAAELCISVKTVETHRAHINRKLGAHNPADLVRYAATRGIFTV